MEESEYFDESDSSEEFAVQLVETEPTPSAVQLGTDPNNLYTLKPNERIFDFNIKSSPWDLVVDETLLEGEGITPGIRYIPSVHTYEAIIVSWVTRPVLRVMPWLVRFMPDMRKVVLKDRRIDITEEQYDDLTGNRRPDDEDDKNLENIEDI